MWRSIAAKSRHVLPRKFFSKVPSSHTLIACPFSQSHNLSTWDLSRTCFSRQELRFFSNLSVNGSENELDHEHSSSLGTDRLGSGNDSSLSFGENNDTQLADLSFVGGLSGNSDTQIEKFETQDVGFDGSEGLEDGVGMEGEQEEGAGGVYEIDMEKLDNVLSLLRDSVDGSLESILNDMGLKLNEEVVVKVLETPNLLGANLIGFFRWAVEKSNFSVNLRLVDAIVQALSGDLRRKDVYALWDLVREIGEKDNAAVNVEILNRLIAMFSTLGKGKVAYEVFNKFEDFGFAADADTYYHTIEVLCRRSLFEWASSVAEKMVDTGALPDCERVGKLIFLLCKGGSAKVAHAIYMLAKEKNVCVPQSAVNFLIGGLSRNDETVTLASEMLNDFPVESRRNAISPFSSVVHGLCNIKDVDGAKKLLSEMIAHGPPPSNAEFNSVIHGYSKSGDLNGAIETMKLMESRGLKPDVYTYTVVISGYVSGGQMEEALKVLQEAKKKHSKLCPATYHTLIRGYCKLGQFDEALQVLAEMKESGVKPNVDEYNKLIQSLCLQAVDWEKAEKLVGEMKSNGFHLNAITQGLVRAIKELEQEGLNNPVTTA